MTLKHYTLVYLFVALSSTIGFSQVPITQYLSINGRYDFIMFGSSNNLKGNSTSLDFNCETDNVAYSTAEFKLPVTSTGIEKAILYWSGSGSGDLDVKLSGPGGLSDLALTSQRTYTDMVAVLAGPRPYFSAFYDVTDIIKTYGEGNYTLSELNADKSSSYCSQTLYSGWSIVVIYEDPTIPLNTVKVYDGFLGISATTINFSLDGIKITNPNGAKLGFLVWEGDNLANLGNEGMSVNGNALQNAINPLGELYNSTNSFTNSKGNYNMDMDYFDISPFVSAGDTKLDIKATAGNDVIFFNTYAITFNNELPDATVKVNQHTSICDSRDITLTYTVYNINSNDTLPTDIDISFYANSVGGIFLGTQKTTKILLMEDSLVQTITLTIPPLVGDEFTLVAVADDGNSVKELEEDNNTFEYAILMPVTYNLIDNQGICEGDTLFWGGQSFTMPISQDFFYTSSLGCDSTVHLNLTVQDIQYTDIDVVLCNGETYILPDSTEVSTAGDYVATISSQYGCDSIVTVHLTIPNETNFLMISGAEQVDLGYKIPLSLNTNFTPDSIQWTPSESVACDSCLATFVQPNVATTYTAWVIDNFGCLLTDSIKIEVIKHDEIYIPNAFSPNGDGINDFLEVFTDRDVKTILSFQVFDRWGSMVFDAKNIATNERQDIWNGLYKGKPLKPDVFVYQVLIEFLDGRTKMFAGDVTIVK